MSLYEYGSEKHIRMEREEGQEEGIELAKRLIEEKRYEDLERSIRDAAYRKQLFLELRTGVFTL